MVVVVVAVVVVTLCTTKRCALLEPNSDEPNIVTQQAHGTPQFRWVLLGNTVALAADAAAELVLGERAAASALRLVRLFLLLCPISCWAAAVTAPAAAAAVSAAAASAGR